MMSEQPASPVWRSWLLLILSGGGALMSFIGAGLLFVGGSFGLASTAIPGFQAVTVFNLAWGVLLVGILCIPAVVFSLLEIRGKPIRWQPKPNYFYLASAGLLVWGLLVFLFKPVETSSLAWLLLPPLVLAVTVLPLWWYIETGRRGLSLPSPAQGWGVISFSLMLTVPIILILELVVLGVVLVVAGAYVSSQPEFASLLADLQRMLANNNVDPQAVADLFSGMLQRPGVVFGLLVVAAGVIPLIEELFKPLAVWLLAGDRLTPAQGFYAGMLSGACFALWENLTALSAAGDGSGTTIVVARVGTGLLHIVTAGLVSWGMASFWQSRQYWKRMIGMYILAVTLHGLWNASGVLTGVGPMLQIPVEGALLTQAVETGAIVVLVTLVFVHLGLLLFANARLRSRPASVETIAAQVSDPRPTNANSVAASNALASAGDEAVVDPNGTADPTNSGKPDFGGE